MIPCTPHPGLGTVSVRRGARVTAVDLATCRETRQPPPRVALPTLTTTPKGKTESLLYRGRAIYSIHERFGKETPEGVPGPLFALGLSPDRRWALFAVDPFGSASIAADGLTLRVVSTRGGRSHALPLMLMTQDSMTWCGRRLVLTAGGDRIAWHDKRLVVTAPPLWRTRLLVRAPSRAWGASTCAPDGRSIVVQSQRSSIDANVWSGSWALWRVTFAGRVMQLTHPPRGSVDESPRYARDGTLYFVRSSRGHGKLYALHHGRVVGPLLSLGYSLGYYGAQNWPYAPTR